MVGDLPFFGFLRGRDDKKGAPYQCRTCQRVELEKGLLVKDFTELFSVVEVFLLFLFLFLHNKG